MGCMGNIVFDWYDGLDLCLIYYCKFLFFFEGEVVD